jgi:hypothetical protein
VRDLRSEHLREASPDAIFFPLAQIPQAHKIVPTATGASEPIDLTIVLPTGEHQRLNRDQLFQHVLAFDSEHSSADGHHRSLPAGAARRACRSSARAASGIARLRTTPHPNCGFPVYNALR